MTMPLGVHALHGLVGGGADVNKLPFKVVAQEDEPVDPSPGLLWIERDIPVGHVSWGYDKPSDPAAEGDVHVRVGSPVIVAFNELAKALNVENEFELPVRDYWARTDLEHLEDAHRWPITTVKNLIEILAKFGAVRRWDGSSWSREKALAWTGSEWKRLVGGYVYVSTGPSGAGVSSIIKLDQELSDPGKVEEVWKHIGFYRTDTVAVDPDGNVYSNGQLNSSGGGQVRKLSPEGDLVWSEQGSSQGGVAVDADGYVYVGTNGIKKLTPEGDLIWSSTGSSPYDLDVDESGYVYASRRTSTGSGSYQRYDPDGELLWSVSFTQARSIAAGTGGNSYRAGGSASGRLVKVDPNGQEIWEYYVGASTRSVAVGSDEYSYIVGGSSRLGKIDPNGQEVWLVTTGVSFENRPKLLAVDVDGYTYISGRPSSGDYFVFKYDPNGQEVWRHPVTIPYSVAVDPGRYGAFPWTF